MAYTPFPLKILGELAKACKIIKERINDEILEIKQQTPESIKIQAYDKRTAVGLLMTNLSDNTSLEEINLLSTLTPEEKARLSRLNEDLASDPSEVARRHFALKTKINNHISRLDQLFSSINNEVFNKLRNLATQSESTRLAARCLSR